MRWRTVLPVRLNTQGSANARKWGTSVAAVRDETQLRPEEEDGGSADSLLISMQTTAAVSHRLASLLLVRATDAALLQDTPAGAYRKRKISDL